MHDIESEVDKEDLAIDRLRELLSAKEETLLELDIRVEEGKTKMIWGINLLSIKGESSRESMCETKHCETKKQHIPLTAQTVKLPKLIIEKIFDISLKPLFTRMMC